MTTLADLIAGARRRLMTGHPDRLNVLSAGVDAVTTTIPLTYDLRGIDEGSVLCIDLEEMHVISISGVAAGNTALVIRAFNGSTAASHNIGAKVYVSPQFSDFRLAQFINTGLDDLSLDLFRIKQVQITYTPAVAGYELTPSDLIDVWRVSFNEPGPANIWPVLDPADWYVDLNADPTTFPSGKQLVLRRGGSPGFPIKVSYRAGFTHLANLNDDVLVVSGLHTEAHDLPSLFAAYMAATGREVKRAFLHQQPERRRAEEVPPGAARMGALEWAEQYERRVNRESERLQRRYPGAI